MNESSVSSAFQTKLRQAMPEAVLVKLADKSMIGLVDASLTARKKTVWIEYKYIQPTTKGVVWREFLKEGRWEPLAVAQASPTQFDMARKLATAGHCCYLFWVLDNQALRKRIRQVVLWHPITGRQYVFNNTDGAVNFFVDAMKYDNPFSSIDSPVF